MKVVIIEDEEAALEQLKMVLDSSEVEIEIVQIIDSVEESIEFFRSVRSKDVDLVFMDIHLSDGYAFSIFKHIEVDIPIIFTTAYDEYALKAFEVNCLDYTLKPISASDIDRIFSKIKIIALHSKEIVESKYPETMLVVDGWRTVPLNVSDIACFYSFGSKVRVYNLLGKCYLINSTLERLEENLDSQIFVRANRQFIISREIVKDMESWDGSRALVNLSVDVPEKVIISRTKVTQFKRWLASK